MDKLTYYAITGMLKVEEDAIETLKKRLSIIAKRLPGLCNIMIEGVAVSVHIFSTAQFCKLIGVKTVENVKCCIKTDVALHQCVYVDYECEGKHRCDTYPLPFSMDKLNDIFDVEYVQPQCLAAWKDRHFKSPDESLKIKTKHSQMHYESVGIS